MTPAPTTSPLFPSPTLLRSSAGNHAQGVAVAAALAQVPATIVMPVQAPIAKVEATRGYGARVLLHGEVFDEAHAEARSEEHTSELQSRFDLVCGLLLEKKTI